MVFFSQGALPALTEGGQIIMEGPSRLAMAPDGNGGVYMAMRAEGALLLLLLCAWRWLGAGVLATQRAAAACTKCCKSTHRYVAWARPTQQCWLLTPPSLRLAPSGVLADMAAHGIEAVDCYCVDNALVGALLSYLPCTCGS